MSDERYPMLDLFYQQYLTDESSADFIQAVSRNYGLGTRWSDLLKPAVV